MWLVTSLAGAIPAVILGMACLGFMPICWKVLERQGRCLGHTLLDFSFVSLIGGCGAGLLFGSVPPYTPPGTKPNIIHQFGQKNGSLAGFGLACGACFTIADVFLQQAMPLVGIVTAAAISNALRIIISVLCNYWLDDQLNDPSTLFPGLAFALLAIVLSAAAQLDHRKTLKRRNRLSEVAHVPPIDSRCNDESDRGNHNHTKIAVFNNAMTASEPAKQPYEEAAMERGKAVVAASGGLEKSRSAQLVADTAPDMGCLPFDLASRQNTIRGLLFSAACGTSYGLYSPAFNIATNDPWNLRPAGVQPLSEWLALFYLYVGLWFASFVINLMLLYRPQAGPPSDVRRYLIDWGRGRAIAILSGIFGLVAAVAELIGGQAGGYAFASLVAAYPLVTTIVGIFAFKEFQGATKRTLVLVVGQFIFYLAAISTIAASAKIRPKPD